MKKVLVSGCNGHMGQIVCRLINESPDMEVRAGVDTNTARTEKYPVISKLSDKGYLGWNVDVIIDFSSPEATSHLIACAVCHKTPLVIATTGISDQDVVLMREAAKEIPIFYSANMSYDVCVFKRILEVAVPLLKDADIEITEEHHRRKADSPSGTAKMLANAINELLNNEKEIVYGRAEKRQTNEIGISSVRGGNVCGTHTVKFFSENDIFEIKHTALSREIFAEGAIRAAKFLMEEERKPGLYTMDDLF